MVESALCAILSSHTEEIIVPPDFFVSKTNRQFLPVCIAYFHVHIIFCTCLF